MVDVQLPEISDPLGEALHFLRMSGTFYCRSELTAPWGIEMPPMPGLCMFHVVTSGSCWIEISGADPIQLRPGELALIPRSIGHRLFDDAGSPTPNLFDLPRIQKAPRYELLRHGGGGQQTVAICGVVEFDHPAAKQLIELLPPVLHIDSWDADEHSWVQSTLQIMASEAKQLRPGGEAIITRLSDILIIQAIRWWIARDPGAQTGWMGALQDPQIGPVVAMIHDQPEAPWTLQTLAAAASMSRSAFAARFSSMLDETPMRYVARWRMYAALTWIRDDRQPISEVAHRLGYRSEASFHRAFKRITGLTPGAARQAPVGAGSLTQG